MSPGKCRENLRQSLFRLAKAILKPANAPAYLIIDHQSVQFNPASDHGLDAAEFNHAREFSHGLLHRHFEHCRRCGEQSV
jgi:DNA-binding SARP family transcriptional activator